MAEPQPFATRTVWWLIAVGVVSFAGAMFFTVIGDRVRSTGANAFSVSAIGHRALVETLERLEFPVIVSRHRSAEKAQSGAVLVVAEPTVEAMGTFDYDPLLDAPVVLYILPKRWGVADDDRPGWLEKVGSIDRDQVQRALEVVAGDLRVERPAGEIRWTKNSLGAVPEIESPQLIKGGGIAPIVAADAGVLVGRVTTRRGRVWVLSDPDVLANHGLGSGNNAAFVVSLLAFLRQPGGAVVFDETHHGFLQPPSLWRAAFRPPFAIVTFQALVAVAVLMWAAVGRFGAPVPVPRPLISGKGALIDNAANLLESRGLSGDVFVRYVTSVQRDVARRLNAPRHLEEGGLVDLLDRIARARGIADSLAALRRETDDLARAGDADDARRLRLAQRFNGWRQEMTDGPRRRRDDRARA